MRHKYSKGFTLVELLIAMALFSLIAASVTLFITSMNRYSQTNNAITERLNEQEDLREEIDKWFAFFDRKDAKIDINVGTPDEVESGNTLVRVKEIVSEGTPVWRYSIIMDSIEGEERLIRFTYPEDSDFGSAQVKTVEIKVSQVKTVLFLKQGDTTQNPEVIDGEKEFTFPITTRVNKANYLCKVIFN